MGSVPKSAPVCQAPSVGSSTPLQLPDVIPGYLPAGGINLLSGAPGVGKTAFLAGLLRDLRDGRPIFGHQPRQVPAIGFVGTDRSWANGAGWWFQQVGFPEILAYSMQDDAGYNVKTLRRRHDRIDILLSFIDRLTLPAGAVVTVDPITPFMGGNLLDYDTCFVASQEIQRYLRMRQYTLIGAAHSGKQKANKQDRYLRMQDRVLGSTALIGFGDTAMYLASPEELEKPYYAFHWQPHRAKAQTHYLERDARGLFIPYLGSDTEEGTSQRVLALFPPVAAVSFADLAESAASFPLSKKTVRRAVDQLLIRNQIVRVDRGLYKRTPIQ